MTRESRWTREHIRAALRPAITFEVWSTIVFLVSFVPASGWVLNRLVSSSGQYAVSDADLVAFALSVPGVLFILFNLGFVLTYWFAEQAAVLMIVLRAHGGRTVSVSRVLWENVRHLPALLRLALRQAAVLLLAAIPLVAGIALTKVLLLREFDFYYFLNVQPPVWWLAVAIAGTLTAAYLLVVGWLYVRWLPAIPALLLERSAPRAALRESWARTRGRFRALALPLAATWVAVLVVSALATWLVGAAAAWLLPDDATLGVLIPLVLVSLGLVAIIDFACFMIGKIVHVMLMARAYLDTRDREEQTFQAAAKTDRPLPLGLIRSGWALACVVLIVTGIAAGAAFLQRFTIERDVAITGHRGNKVRKPENTLTAVQLAIEEGADFAEIDVQTTADGEVVLLHDADLMRVASDPRRLNALTREELRDIDVGSWFDPAFGDERIPTLQEVIDLARGRIRLNIELKYTWEDPTLARSVGRIVRRNDFVSDCVVSSLNVDALVEIERSFPELTTGLIVFQAVGDLSRMPADFLSISAASATPSLVRAVQRRGGAVHVWTVSDVGNALSMIEMGVDNIITDEPRLIRNVLEEWNALSDRERLALMLRSLIVGFDPPPPTEL